jgi:restriction system protein
MIPDYQSVMLHIIKFLSDGVEHNVEELASVIIKNFHLTQEESTRTLPNSQKKVINNRIHWARSHLKVAGIIEYPSKGVVRITERGKQLLSENPASIDIHFLMNKYPDYREKYYSWRRPKTSESFNKLSDDIKETEQTPEEQIANGYKQIRQSLEQEILSKLKSIYPSFFEKIVVELLVKMGYGGSISEAGKATRYTNDEGIDGIIKEDKLGLDVIYIQAKRWDGTVSRPEIQKFVGALAGQRAKKGVFITTSDFSKEAIVYASQMDTKIVLIDGLTLAQYMIDYNLGVSVKNTYEIKKMDSDYFEEE